jgi:hypothetical protein
MLLILQMRNIQSHFKKSVLATILFDSINKVYYYRDYLKIISCIICFRSKLNIVTYILINVEYLSI